MIKVLLFDFSKVLAFSNDETYTGDLNPRHDELKTTPGFKFFDHFRINDELINELKLYKEKVKVVIFTSGDIQEDTELVATGKLSVFDQIINLESLKDKIQEPSKTDKETYLEVCRRIGVEPNEVVFIDDSENNVASAVEAGINAIQFVDNESLREKLKEALEV